MVQHNIEKYNIVHYPPLLYSVVHCSTGQAAQFNTKSTVQYSKSYYSSVPYIQYIAVQYSIVKYSKVQFSIVQCSRVECRIDRVEHCGRQSKWGNLVL